MFLMVVQATCVKSRLSCASFRSRKVSATTSSDSSSSVSRTGGIGDAHTHERETVDRAVACESLPWLPVMCRESQGNEEHGPLVTL